MPSTNLNSLQPYELSLLLTIINGKITNMSAFLTDTFSFNTFIFTHAPGQINTAEDYGSGICY